MKNASTILLVIGVLGILAAFLGRIIGYNSVSLMGLVPRMKASSVLLIGNTFVLLSVITFLYSKK